MESWLGEGAASLDGSGHLGDAKQRPREEYIDKGARRSHCLSKVLHTLPLVTAQAAM